ncbi:unnamed protein product [Discula destructiva]
MVLSTKYAEPGPSFDPTKYASKRTVRVPSNNKPMQWNMPALEHDSKVVHTNSLQHTDDMKQELVKHESVDSVSISNGNTFDQTLDSAEVTTETVPDPTPEPESPQAPAALTSEPVEVIHQQVDVVKNLSTTTEPSQENIVCNLVQKVQHITDKIQQIAGNILDLHGCVKNIEKIAKEIQETSNHKKTIAPEVVDASNSDLKAEKLAESRMSEPETTKASENVIDPVPEAVDEQTATIETPQLETMQPSAEESEAWIADAIAARLGDIPVPDEDLEAPDARRLVSIRRIQNIRQVQVQGGWMAVAQVDGWTCQVPRHPFRDGDLAVFCMIDSFLPASDKRFGQFSTWQTFQGSLGHRVKTERFGYHPNKLEVQGRLYPLDRFSEIYGEIKIVQEALGWDCAGKLSKEKANDIILAMYRKKDWAEELKVVKWVELAQVMKPAEFSRIGNLPTSVFKKTDITHFEDCPNLFTKRKYRVNEYQQSVKMDGASMTVYFVRTSANKFHDLNKLPEGKIGPNMDLKTGRFGVCSKNIDLHELGQCSIGYWKVALLNDLPAKLVDLDRSIAIQGEICGPGINQNRENLTEPQFFVYSMWDVTAQKYINPRRVEALAARLGLEHVPVLGYVKITAVAENHDGLRQLANERPGEGLVFKCVDDGRSFKVHSSAYKILHNC